MRPTKIALHLIVNVQADRLTINALVAELEDLQTKLFAALVDGLQQNQLQAVRAREPLRFDVRAAAASGG